MNGETTPKSQICDNLMPKLLCHHSKLKRSEVQECYDAATESMKASFEVAIEYLQAQPRQNWVRPRAAKLQKGKENEFREYFEIRFKCDNVQQRPIGYFGPKENEFTILIWATEKGGKIIPTTWKKTADQRRISIDNGEDHAKKIEFQSK